ncbi:MAG: beta-1,6-glucan synthase [Rhodospirillales bacterium]|nr:beta-1,6-glucan synthase [Rhodospirillales bacterium]
MLAAFAGWAWMGRLVPVADPPSERFSCLSYAPFRGDQTPFDPTLVIPYEQIEYDLTLLAERTECVRTYSVDIGLGEVLPIANRLGMKVMLGVWIGWEEHKNLKELDRAIALVQRYPETVKALIVGNEVLLRREQPPEKLIALIERARAAVPESVPVTYADVWEFWRKHPEVSRAVDLMTIHTLPYWEDHPIPIEHAVAHVGAIARKMQAEFPDKPIVIGEAGWPSAGRMRRGAEPTPVNQARFIRELMRLSENEGIGLNLIEAFDQPWKRLLEGTVGGHWGVYNEDRTPKFPLSGPVSNDPRWLIHFAAGALLGLALLLPVFMRRRALSVVGWFVAAFASQAAGVLLVVGGLAALDATLDTFDALSWGSRWLFAAAAVVLALIALTRGDQSRPALPTSLFELLSAWRQRRRPHGSRLGAATGGLRAAVLLTAAVTTLCFLFDARYRDFPVALTIVPALAFLAITWMERRHRAALTAKDDLREEKC